MKERAKKRLFIAIDISEEARVAASAYINRLKNEWPDCRISWIKPENLHLTLKFLGDVEERRIIEIADAVRKATAGALNFQLEVSGTAVFPSARKPKVLWLGFKEESGNLERLTERLEEKCEEIGFPIDERKFSPHLTIGRVRDPRSARLLAGSHVKNEFDSVRFNVNQVVLYESKLDPNGSIYTPLSSAPLG
jgi:2'-5' RNA ligase